LASLAARSRCECCFASCSTISCRRRHCSCSCCSMRTHLRPWLWASCTYSLHACTTWQAPTLLKVMRKRVARSLTARTRAAASGPGPPSSCSRSVRERCSAVPCLAMRSLHMDRSSSLTCSRRSTVSSSLLSSWLGMSSSSTALRIRHALSPDSIMRTALALASSRAVTHFWRSISLLAFRWNVCVPPLEMTKLHESSVWITALTRLMVPRQVCAISAWFL
ncbi:unnamed protein product, partial [Ixodes pacificus]